MGALEPMARADRPGRPRPEPRIPSAHELDSRASRLCASADYKQATMISSQTRHGLREQTSGVLGKILHQRQCRTSYGAFKFVSIPRAVIRMKPDVQIVKSETTHRPVSQQPGRPTPENKVLPSTRKARSPPLGTHTVRLRRTCDAS